MIIHDKLFALLSSTALTTHTTQNNNHPPKYTHTSTLEAAVELAPAAIRPKTTVSIKEDIFSQLLLKLMPNTRQLQKKLARHFSSITSFV